MEQQEPLISICIPAYKRTELLKRLLDSISVQTFRDFEVVITDDSPDEEVGAIVETFRKSLPRLFYKRNGPPLGTPANWNESISHCRGKWVKLMHDDDWFTNADSLAKFAAACQKNPGAFLFSSYHDVFLASDKKRRIIPPAFRYRMLPKEPAILLSRNIIGPPSVVMHRNDGSHLYDTRMKWLVDIDMYVRRLQTDKITYLPEPLVQVGIGETQVTASVHGAPEVEVPEYFLFLQKTGTARLRHVLVYDAWWRFIRNFRLFDEKKIRSYGWEAPIDPAIKRMMTWQDRLPLSLLDKGVFSKIIMLLHFLLFKRKIHR